jgi:hypothetical protein
MRPFFLHQKPPKDFKGLASRVTFIPSGEVAWPQTRSTRTLEENRAASERMRRIRTNGGQLPT